ncbi:MAG: TIGR00282 family metallophosphoesterase [Solobacterium sp.]|nr:TIGR00282 family metallophosphoesterase [Solobacterium sp.]MBR0214097.1 TIGR00282 family metallophosphoesterase [Solobacterium sp.]
MRILFLGDVTARSGRDAVIAELPRLKQEYGADFTIVNGENAAHGKGITTKIYRALKEAGADLITLGNHAFSKSEIITGMGNCPDLIRPANLEPADAGSCWAVRTCQGRRIAVINLLGNIFMDCATESPFAAMDRILPEVQADAILVDLHAETTSEKQLFFHRYRQRVSAVIGTHTHVQTADERVLDGCAFISDVGMCGPYESIIGRSIEEVMARMIDQTQTRFTPAEGPAIICGVVIEIDDNTGRARSIERIQKRPF